MHPFIILLLVTAVLSALHAGVVVGRQGPRHTNYIAAALIFEGAIWSTCQVLWNTAPDPETALFYIRLSGLGWMGIAPLALHLHLNLHPGTLPRARHALWAVYAASAAFYALDLFTPLIHTEAVPTSWGYSYRLGWPWPIALAGVLATVIAAVSMGVRNISYMNSPAERHQMRWLVAALAIPIVAGSTTDGLFPFFDVHVPKLGSTSILALGVVTAWSFQRYGYSIMVPHDFASEILSTLPEGVALVQLDGRIRSVNRGLGALSGYEPHDLEGTELRDLLPALDFEAVLEGEPAPATFIARRSGERLPVAISTNRLRDKSGRDIAIVVLVQDQREIESLRSHLVTSGRLAAVGELAAGVAHEINNPLTYVRANLSLLESHWETLRKLDADDARRPEIDAEGEELIVESLEGVDRAVAIVRDIKGLAHAGSGQLESVDLNPLLDAVLRVTETQLGETTRVERDFAELPLVDAIPQELKQVFINLVVNAGQAMEGGGLIRIETRADDGWVEARVADGGPGIEPEILERIFDPFFTTKPVGTGTGLGLSISHEIVRRHGGELSVDSERGRGATFVVRLRAHARSAASGATSADPTQAG